MTDSAASARAALLANAINFLQDPQVKTSSLARQIEFLEGKGLTRSEIDEALRAAGVLGSSTQLLSPPLLPSNLPPPLPSNPPPPLPSMEELGRERALVPQSGTFNWHRLLLIMALLGSTGMAISQSFIANYIKKFFFLIKKRILGRQVEENGKGEVDQLKREVQSLRQLHSSLNESMKDLRETLRQELDAIKTSQNYLYRELSQDIGEMREELRDINLQPIEMNSAAAVTADDDGGDKGETTRALGPLEGLVLSKTANF